MSTFKSRLKLNILYLGIYFVAAVIMTYSLQFMEEFLISYIGVAFMWLYFPFHARVLLNRKIILNSEGFYFQYKRFKKVIKKGFYWVDITEIEYCKRRLIMTNQMSFKLFINREWENYNTIYKEIYEYISINNPKCHIDASIINYLNELNKLRMF